MEHSRKMIVIPSESEKDFINEQVKEPLPTIKHIEIKPKKSNKIKQSAEEKFTRIVKLILALAKIDGYNEDGNIRSGENYLPLSNIVSLIQYAVTPGKALVGETEFIQLLLEANIDTSLILNERIKFKLKYMPVNNKSNENITLTHTRKESPIVISNTYKRSIEEDDEIEPKRKRQAIDWIVPSDDEN